MIQRSSKRKGAKQGSFRYQGMFLWGLCLISFQKLFCAGPVMHLWVLEQFCGICEVTDETARRDLFLGCEFPDIRYISRCISRKSTHPVIANVCDIVAETTDCFTVGIHLHSWTDSVREEAIDPDVYKELASYEKEKKATLLKFIEDEVLADLYDGRSWCGYLNTILPEELAFAGKNTIMSWHRLIRLSLSVRPSWLLFMQSFRGPKLNLSTDKLYEWSFLIPQLAKDPFFKNHVESLLSHLRNELETLSDEKRREA